MLESEWNCIKEESCFVGCITAFWLFCCSTNFLKCSWIFSCSSCAALLAFILSASWLASFLLPLEIFPSLFSFLLPKWNKLLINPFFLGSFFLRIRSSLSSEVVIWELVVVVAVHWVPAIERVVAEGRLAGELVCLLSGLRKVPISVSSSATISKKTIK